MWIGSLVEIRPDDMGREILLPRASTVEITHAVARAIGESPDYALGLRADLANISEYVTVADYDDGYWIIRLIRVQ